MRLYFVPPGQGQPLTDGELRAETGELIEGVLIQQVWPETNNLEPVQFTMLVEKLPPLDADVEEDALHRLAALEDSLRG